MMEKTMLLLLLASVVPAARGLENRVTSRDLRRVLKNYASMEPPDPPVKVKIGIYINSMKLDYQEGLMVMGMYYRESWTDKRLEGLFNKTSATRASLPKLVDEIWKPDVFVKNSVQASKVHTFAREENIILKPGGEVYHVMTINVALNCPALLTEEHIIQCSIYFESYGNTVDTIVLNWMEIAGPVVFADPAVPNNFYLTKFFLNDCSRNFTTGAYPCLEVRFEFKPKEKFVFFGKAIYTMSILLVLASWLGFWIPPSNTRILMPLGVILILSILFLTTAIWSDHTTLPKTQATQGWLLFCMALVFAMVLEYVAVYVLTGPIKARVVSTFRGKIEADMEPKRSRCGEVVDVVCGILVFPITFIVVLILHCGFNIRFI